MECDMTILLRLQQERNAKLKGGLYHVTQIAMAYNSNRIEGNQLTHEQTRLIYETKTLIANKDTTVKADDVIETVNHFAAFDYMLETCVAPLSESLIKEFHRILKQGTLQSRLDWFTPGEYKSVPNVIGSMEIPTVAPEDTGAAISSLLQEYSASEQISFESIVRFHYGFEKIHPFQDGNGRVGRLILFRECLVHGIPPFIIDAEHRAFYYRGLQQYGTIPEYLNETCRSAQDEYTEICKTFQVFPKNAGEQHNGFSL